VGNINIIEGQNAVQKRYEPLLKISAFIFKYFQMNSMRKILFFSLIVVWLAIFLRGK
jgi:hypothetical protein